MLVDLMQLLLLVHFRWYRTHERDVISPTPNIGVINILCIPTFKWLLSQHSSKITMYVCVSTVCVCVCVVYLFWRIVHQLLLVVKWMELSSTTQRLYISEIFAEQYMTNHKTCLSGHAHLRTPLPAFPSACIKCKSQRVYIQMPVSIYSNASEYTFTQKW